jgi:hypothetical protein
MRVHVDEARGEHQAGTVDDAVGTPSRRCRARQGDAADATARHREVGPVAIVSGAVDDRDIGEQ